MLQPKLKGLKPRWPASSRFALSCVAWCLCEKALCGLCMTTKVKGTFIQMPEDKREHSLDVKGEKIVKKLLR